MSKLTLEKDAQGLRATLSGATPILAPIPDQPGIYHLRVEAEGLMLCAEITTQALQTLGLQCIALMPAIGPQYTVASVEEAFRLPARALKELDDRAIQILLRECQSDSLIDFLWYMKDPLLAQCFMRNLSQRAAQMLTEDLIATWQGKNPDTALAAYAQRGRDAVADVMEITRRLIDEGQIPDVLGTGGAA